MKKTGGSRKGGQMVAGKIKGRVKSHSTISEGTKPLDQSVAKFAQFLFSITTSFCTSVCCIPLKRLSEFHLEASSFPRREAFIAVTSFYLLSAAHKCLIFGLVIFSEKNDTLKCLCMIPCSTYAGYIIFCMLIAFHINESIELIRGWSEVLSRFNFPGKNEITAFSQKRSSLICIQLFLATSACTLAYPVCSCLLSDIPFFVIATANSLGVVDTQWMPQWVWAVSFTPIETISYAGPFALLSFGLMVIFIEFGIEKRCADMLRDLSKSDRTYKKAAQLFTILRLHNKICAALLGPAIAPSLFTVGSFVVFGLYTALRTTDLPHMAVATVVYTCLVILAAIYFLSADAVAIIQASEEVIRNLQARDNPFFRGIPVAERKMHLKRMRALQPLGFPVGHFGTLSFGVTQVVYEEILNQLVFLLSL